LNSDYDPKFKLGYYAAGIISFPLKKDFSAVIEGGFSRKGRKVVIDEGFGTNNSNSYFFDGVLLLRKAFKFYISEDVPADWFVNIGPHISYWISGSGKYYNQSYDFVFADSINTNDNGFTSMYLVDANRWLFGLDIGVGFDAPLKKTSRVLAELRFTWGHTFYGGGEESVWLSNAANFQDDLRANERILTFTVCYMWDVDLQARKKGRSTKDKEVDRKPVKRRR
jgi:hypothetical protein